MTVAGSVCQPLCEAEPFSPAGCETLRLPGEDSSISARIACKSSDAEITGNNRTKAHPSVQTNTSVRAAGPFPRPSAAAASRSRHNK